MTGKFTSTDSILAPIRAIKFIFQNKGIWHFIIIPIIINVIVFLTLGGFAYWWLFDQLTEWFSFSNTWYISILTTFLKAMAGIVIFFITMALIAMAANIFAAPFNELLSRKTESILLNPKTKNKFRLKLWTKDIFKSLIQEIIIFILFIIIQIFLFLLNFIPAIGTLLYLLINILLISYLYCFQYLTYTMDQHQIPFFKRWKLMFSSPFQSFWFGVVCGMGMIIPLVNMFYIPVCVVAGTMLYKKYNSEL